MSKILNPTIAIIDSGIGGVSVLKQLIAKYKYGNYLYFADNLYMPYGNKSQKFIKKRMDNIILKLQNEYKVNYIVIACNTASTCIDKTQYRNVITMEFNKNHIYLATLTTKKNLPGFEIIDDKRLAKKIETNIFNKTKIDKIIKKHSLNNHLYKENEIILGCTHYELVKNIFEKYCPNTNFINNSEFILSKINLNIYSDDLNIIVLTSKKDRELENKILKIINT